MTNVLLWTAQVLLAALFLFAGGFKLALSAEALEQQAQMSGTFLHFIGAMELLGGLGLLLPGLTRIKTYLTPLAAAGLVIIMLGATITTVASHGLLAAIFPFAICVITALVAYGRSPSYVVSGFSRTSRA